MKKKLFTILTVFVLLLVVGCKKEDKTTLVVELEGNPTTGYQWAVLENTNNEIVDIKDEYVADEHEEGMAGVGGKYKFTIKALKAGTTTITFAYKRVWEETEEDKKVTYIIEVNEDLSISETHTEIE